MSDIMKFDFGDNNIRVFGTADNPLFVAMDVCECLGLKNHRQVLSALDEDEKDDVHIMDSIGRSQKTLVLTEPGLYSLMNKSIKPEAKKFQRWVYHDVIPSIRKNGIYSIEQQKNNTLERQERIVQVLDRLDGNIGALDGRMTDIEKKIDGVYVKLEAIEEDRPRKKITVSTYRMHIKTVINHFNLKCPCCASNTIIDETGDFIGEIDHWVMRSVRKADATWPVCKACNTSFKIEYMKTEARKFFEVYQERRRLTIKSQQTIMFKL